MINTLMLILALVLCFLGGNTISSNLILGIALIVCGILVLICKWKFEDVLHALEETEDKK